MGLYTLALSPQFCTMFSVTHLMKFNRDWVEHSHGNVNFLVLRGVRGEEEGVLEMACLKPQRYLIFD